MGNFKKNTPTPCKIFYSNIGNSLKNASAQLIYNTYPLTTNNIIVFIDVLYLNEHRCLLWIAFCLPQTKGLKNHFDIQCGKSPPFAKVTQHVIQQHKISSEADCYLSRALVVFYRAAAVNFDAHEKCAS